MEKEINVTLPFMPPIEEYINEIRELWESKYITNMGKKHDIFQEKLVHYLSTPNVILFVNGHLALESVISALKLKGEIITTPFTFVSTTHAIKRSNLKPVFCDINEKNYTIDPDKIEELINKNTSAILPVHVYGNICDYKRINEIAEKYELKVIYDAAHAFGVEIDEHSVANLGDASMFSFHATKVFHSIEGGAITTEDDALSSILKSIRNFGFNSEGSVEIVGMNAKMNEFQAAMGICNLRYIEKEINKRKRIVERYFSLLSPIEGITVSLPPKNVKSNYSYFPVLFDNKRFQRDEIFEKLKRHKIFPRKYFYPLTSSLKCYRNTKKSKSLKVSKYVAERILTLPLFGDLSLETVDKICEIILNKK